MGFYSSARTGPPNAELELDLTNSHLPSLEDVPIPDTLEYVDLTANRLKEIDDRILELTGVQYLCFRQNLIRDASSLDKAAFKATLEELHLNDNQISEVPVIHALTALTKLELSYNHEIRTLMPLEQWQCTQLQELYCCENKVTSISGICQLTALSILELGSNRIKVVESLGPLVQLQQLWLGRNRIADVGRGLDTLTNLRQLSLQANRLESIGGLEALTALEELYLSQNGIHCISGLESLALLKVIDLAYNPITKVEGLAAQTLLTDLWLNDTQVADLDHLESALQACRDTLEVVYLANSPAAQSTQAYLLFMKALLPKLEYLDSTPITR
eukprot:jgi/Ulvmu1/11467/UM077_0010.1